MKKNPDTLTDAAALRRRAEQKLQAQQPAINPANEADADVRKLLQELQVHQIELEMQNEELRQARTEADALLTRYTELYDFAPVGYFTLDHDGMIRQTNLTGARMLGVERGKLDKRRLGNFVEENDRAVFSEFLGRVFAGQTREVCDLTLMCTGNMPRLMHIEADADETGQTCRMAMTDITEFRTAQQQLARQVRQIENAELEWKSVFDSVLDPIFLHDKEFRILRCNKAYQQCAGMPFVQIIGQPYYEIFPKAATPLPSCLRTMEKAEEEEEEEEEEVAVGDASYRSRSFSVQDEQGVYLYSVHVLEDITERKQSTEVLQRSKDLLRSVVENAPARIFWKDRDLRYLGGNTLFAKDAGYSSPDELTGKTDFEMGWKDQAGLYRADDEAVMESGIPKLDFEEPQTTPDGNTIWLITSKVPLRDKSNQIIGILGTYLDITERKRAETAFRERNTLIETLLENAPIGFAMNSMDDGRVTYVSRRFAEIYGVTPGTLESVTDFFEKAYRDPVFREQIRARVLADIGSGDATRMHWEDVPIITASGETRFVSASNIPLPEQNLMISTVWDVTDRYKAAADLAEQVEELRRWHDATLGREMRILELKSEVNELLGQAGQPPRYPSATADDTQEK